MNSRERAMELLVVLALGISLCGQAKDAKVEIVPIDKEPSHHLVFENEYVRVFSVEVAPHSETKYHQHDRDYVWVSLGDSDVESVRVGASAVALQPKDGETQFTKGGFAHKAVNKSDKPFRNVTVELKGAGGVGTKLAEGMTSCDGGVCTEFIITASNVSCERLLSTRAAGMWKKEFDSKNYFGGGEPYQAGVTLEEGKKYLLIPSVPSYMSGSFQDRKNAVDLNIGSVKWFDGRTKSVITLTGHAGLTYCEFKDDAQGPSGQEGGPAGDRGPSTRR